MLSRYFKLLFTTLLIGPGGIEMYSRLRGFCKLKNLLIGPGGIEISQNYFGKKEFWDF